MSSPQYIKGACVNCGGHIEFPAEALGARVKCPHCNWETQLLDNLSHAPRMVAPAPAAAIPAAAAPPPVAPSTVRSAAPDRSKFIVACPACGLEVSRKARSCPACNAVLKKSVAIPWKPIAMAAGVIVLVAGGWFGWTKWKSGAGTAPGPAATAGEPAKPKRVGKGLEVLEYQLEKLPDRSLVYVVGTVTNGSDNQIFGLRVNFDVADKEGNNIGTATDYLDVLEPWKDWSFRALVLDTNAASAKLVKVEKDDEKK
jgi:hypothetical protein